MATVNKSILPKKVTERELLERDLIRIYNSKTWKIFLFQRKIKDIIRQFLSVIKKYSLSYLRLLKYKLENRKFYDPEFTYSDKNPVHYLLSSKGYEPEISVIIPHFNQSGYINHTLNSLKDQSFQDFEIIIIDDGSSKNQLKALKILAERYRFTLIINENNYGPGYCRNLGINKSSGRYILCLDSDDILPNYALMEMIIALKNNANYGFVYGNYQYFGYKNYLEKRWKYNFYKLLKENYIIVTSLFKKMLWEECGSFDENMIGYEDWEFWINLGKNGWYGYYLNKVLLNVRIKKRSRNLVAINKNKELIKYMKEKHKDIYNPKRLKEIKTLWK